MFFLFKIKIFMTNLFLKIFILLPLFSSIINYNLNEKKKLLRKLEPTPSSSSSSSGASPSSSSSRASSSSSSSGTSAEKSEEKLQNKCNAQRPYEPSDCFNIEFEYGDDYMSKCCFLEYKDKGNNNKKMRECFIVSYNQFLDIKQTIKDLKNKDEFKNRTSISLECDKSSFLFLRKISLLIIALLLT